MTIQDDFLKACKNNDLEKVNAILENYDFHKKWFGKVRALFTESLNPAHNNNEALFEAAKNGNQEVVDRLLKIREVLDNGHTLNNNVVNLLIDNPFVLERFLIDYLNDTQGSRIPKKFILEAIDHLNQKQSLNQNPFPVRIEKIILDKLYRATDIDQHRVFQNKTRAEKIEMVNSAILHAAQSVHEGIFCFLLSNPSVKKYFTFNQSDANYKNILAFSVNTGNLEGVKLLLEIPKINSIFKENYSQLLDDTLKNNTPEMQALLKTTFKKLYNAPTSKRNEPEQSDDNASHSAKNQRLREPAFKNEVPAAIPLLPNAPLVTALYQSAKQREKHDLLQESSDEDNIHTPTHQDKKPRG